MSDLHPLSGAYAVDALDDLERARFERHLGECPDCTAEVASLREAAGLLALSVDEIPSAALRSRVLSQIGTVRPLPPTAPAGEVVRRTVRRFPQLVAAAVAVAAVATGVGVVTSQRSDNPPVASVSVAERVMDASDARTQSVSLSGGGEATVWHSRSVGRAVLVTKNMPATPKGKVYEIWFQDADGTFIPAGLMDSGGTRTLTLHGEIKQAKGVGVTVEPARGSKHPTSLPVAMFDLRKSV